MGILRKDGTALADRIARRLADDLRADRFPSLPPIRQLAVTYQVAYPTMWKAVRLLADRKILSVSHGRRTRRAHEELRNSVLSFHDVLLSRVADGSFRLGRALPKYAYFQREFRVSRNTITAALEQAAGEGIIYKEGKRWIVGARGGSDRRMGAARRRTPTVLIIVTERRSWFDLNQSTYNQPFTNALLAEFRDYGMHVQLAIEREDARVASAPAGIGEMISFIRDLGSDYSGTLIAHMQAPFETVGAWARRLCGHGKPVVLYDNSNFLGRITRQSSGKNAQLFRCHFDDTRAIELALGSLLDRGHRRIGLLYTHGKVEWMQHRLQLLIQTADRVAPEMTLATACLEDEFGVFDDMRDERSRQVDMFDIDSFIRRFGAAGVDAGGAVPARASAARLLWEKAGSLRELLRTHRVTAMIAPNDFYQQKVYLWATSAGLRVPEDVSLVSFDNSTESFIFPLASIDPGFSYLGYLAAHLFIGDMAVRADRWGDIPGRCRLVNRGSLATPRASEKAIEALG